MANLTRVEAAARAALLDVTAYRIELDLDRGDRAFESTATITFTCREPGASTFLDLRAESVHEVTLNGKPLGAEALDGDRLTLPDLATDNEVVVSATMRYSRDGQGLHRAVDPADGLHYVYGHLFLDAAPRVFGCFDQPDLKAPFDVQVTAPDGWIVVGNGAARREADGPWRLATTRPLATYFVTVCAGPYATVADEHDGIPLAIHARASLREPLALQAGQMLEVTKACFDYYHSLFGLRYPFGEYHQVFVPEFNAGAMENPGCVTFRDQMIFRGATTRQQVLRRSNTIAHEMAHMWFGDLVTMRWWDDLWLNESFAEYMAHRTLVAATEFDEAWVDAAMSRKTWGYAAERMPSTHPVAGAAAPNVETALQNFDGISYAKGSSVLRQLIAYIGDGAFIAGLTAYLQAHRFGNADLADFLEAMEEASGQDLDGWAEGWLRAAGLDALSLRTEVEQGRISEAELVRTPARAHPADRPHTIDVAGFAGGGEVFRLHTTITADRTPLPQIVGRPIAAVVVPNASDLTWANVKLDGSSVDALPAELARIDDAATRAVVWTALLDGVSLAEVDPRAMLSVFEAAWALETNDSILGSVAELVGDRVIPAFLHESEHEAARAVLARVAQGVVTGSRPGSSRALTAARVVAAHTGDEALLEGWAVGEALPPGLEGDFDFRWIAVGNLARRGLWDDEAIDRALALDQTIQGRLNALQARASRPDADAKAWAWQELTAAGERSNHEMNALALGFWQTRELDMVRPYVSRYFRDVPALGHRVGEDALARVASLSYPHAVVERSVTAATAHALDRDDLSGAVRRAMVDQQALLLEAVRSRELFPPAEQATA
jgi:aminopeptidase N